MAKTIIKEIIIMLLLCLAIILVLGVLLYEYVPSNKIIPDEVSYTKPDEIKEELSKTDNDDDDDDDLPVISINAADLDNYERINTYIPGKPNPFSSYETAGEDTNQNGSSTGGSSNSGTNGSGSSNTSTSTGGSEYYPDTGTK